MNIYARYFDQDVLVYSLEELIEFLSGIPDIDVTEDLVNDIRGYLDGDMPYPKRYKVRPRVYFILIKTNAATMEDFKANKQRQASVPEAETEPMSKKEMKTSALQEERYGWYRGQINFKRVIQIPGTGKFQYLDTVFSALVLAQSGMECYNKIVEHLKNRQDVDLRSQFPSARGVNFDFAFVGTEEEIAAAEIEELEDVEESEVETATSVEESAFDGDDQEALDYARRAEDVEDGDYVVDEEPSLVGVDDVDVDAQEEVQPEEGCDDFQDADVEEVSTGEFDPEEDFNNRSLFDDVEAEEGMSR